MGDLTTNPVPKLLLNPLIDGLNYEKNCGQLKFFKQEPSFYTVFKQNLKILFVVSGVTVDMLKQWVTREFIIE